MKFSVKGAVRHIVFSVLSVLGGVTLGAALVGAATTISTNIATDGTLAVTGLSTLTAGFVSQASSTVVGAFTATGASTLTGLVTTGAGITVGTLASSTTLKVGNDQVSTISGMIFGTCTIPATALTASTTTQVNCANATGVTTSYKVFVQATSSLPSMVVIQSATSTSGAIQVRLFNTGIGTTTDGGIDPTTLNFWAVR